MTVGSISTSNVNAIKGTNLEGMSIQMMAAMVMLEVGATKKKEAELKIADMKAQNDKAKALNAFLDKLNSKLGAFTKDEDTDKIGRGKVLNELADEAKSFGLDTTGWKAKWVQHEIRIITKVIKLPGHYNYKATTGDQARAIASQIQHMAENCNSDNQYRIFNLQHFMGQYNSFISGASDQIKTANQILQGLTKN